MIRFLILLVLAIAAAVGIKAFSDHAGGIPFAQLFLDADMVGKMVSFLLLLTAAFTFLIGFISLADRSGATRGMLIAITFAAPTLGIVGGLYGATSIYRGIQSVGPVSSQVWAPGAAEALIPVAIGLAAGAVAALFLAFRKKPTAA